MKNIFKRIIIPVYLLIFLLVLVVPFSTVWAAPRLTINADTVTLKSGDDIFISAKMYELVNKTIFFISSPIEGVIFDPGSSCVTSAAGNPSVCSVGFRSTKTGNFTITARTNYNGILQSENPPVVITITEKNVSPTCAPNETFNPTTNKCEACNSPKIIVNGECEDKITEEGCKTVNRVLNVSTNRCDCVSPNTEVSGLCKTYIPIPPGEGNTKDTNTTYQPLAPLPGLGDTIQTDSGCKFDEKGNIIPGSCTNPCPFGNYLNIIIKLVIGIAAVLAMVMIVMGGIEYMTSDLISSKEAGKDTIRNAILGLLIALGAYLILNTINPQLLSVCLDKLPQATITISPDDTSTGSSTSLCISTTNPPNPDSAKGTSMKSVMSKPAMPEYEKVINTINSISKGKKYLATAQAGVEGFYPGSKSYKTNNPGNIGNTDDGKTRSFPTLKEGIVAQTEKVVSGQGSYKIGSKPTCALGNEVYDGSLYQYLRIYATGARVNNNYVNAIIGYFSDNGKNITARTKMSDIYNMQ